MTRDQVQQALAATPFVPFALRMPDGRALAVPHPEFISLSPQTRIVWVWDRHGAGQIVDLMLVSNLEFTRRGPVRRRPRRSA